MKLNLCYVEIDLRRIKRVDPYMEPIVFWFTTGKSKQCKGYSFYVNKSEGKRIIKSFSKKEIDKIELKKKQKLTIYLK